MENKFKIPENITNLAKQKRMEKTQTELREALDKRFLGMKNIIKQATDEYKNALKDGVFENQEGEEENTGEKRKEIMQNKINALFDKAEQMKEKINSKEKLTQYTESISATYTNPDNQIKNITLSIEEKLEENIAIYKKTKLDLPPDFEEQIKEIWENNVDDIQKVIEENGFDEILVLPGNIALTDLNNKMTDGYTETWQSSNFKEGGSFAKAKSQNVDKSRIVLVHKTQNLKDRPELEKTLNIKGEDVNQKNILTLEDYLVFQRKYFEETKKHLDADGATWLATKSGARLVFADWDPGDGRVFVYAFDLADRDGPLGARPSRSFF